MELKEIIGLSFINIEVQKQTILFTANNGDKYRMDHEQDCCESVWVEDVIGDIEDLLNSPILKAEEATSKDVIDGKKMYYDESFTWTFYKLATIKGYVDIRWFGSSNGYYSESVDFYKLLG